MREHGEEDGGGEEKNTGAPDRTLTEV